MAHLIKYLFGWNVWKCRENGTFIVTLAFNINDLKAFNRRILCVCVFYLRPDIWHLNFVKYFWPSLCCLPPNLAPKEKTKLNKSLNQIVYKKPLKHIRNRIMPWFRAIGAFSDRKLTKDLLNIKVVKHDYIAGKHVGYGVSFVKCSVQEINAFATITAESHHGKQGHHTWRHMWKYLIRIHQIE